MRNIFSGSYVPRIEEQEKKYTRKEMFIGQSLVYIVKGFMYGFGACLAVKLFF